MAQVGPGHRVRQDLGEEQALCTFQPLLLFQGQPGLGGERLSGGEDALFRRQAAKLVYAQEARARGGELVVDP